MHAYRRNKRKPAVTCARAGLKGVVDARQEEMSKNGTVGGPTITATALALPV
jgi:hypothetical protein